MTVAPSRDLPPPPPDFYPCALPLKDIERVGGEIEIAENEYELERAAELKYGKLPSLKVRG